MHIKITYLIVNIIVLPIVLPIGLLIVLPIVLPIGLPIGLPIELPIELVPIGYYGTTSLFSNPSQLHRQKAMVEVHSRTF